MGGVEGQSSSDQNPPRNTDVATSRVKMQIQKNWPALNLVFVMLEIRLATASLHSE